MKGDAGRTYFLFRSDQGVIDAPTWRRHSGWLVLLAVVLTGIWHELAPYAHHDLRTTAFLAPMTIVAFAYLIVFAFAVIFIAISFYNLSAKRLRARGLPTGLAGLVPLGALLAGAASWLQPQVPDVISVWYVLGLDLLLVAATIWTAVDLGFRVEHRKSER